MGVWGQGGGSPRGPRTQTQSVFQQRADFPLAPVYFYSTRCSLWGHRQVSLQVSNRWDSVWRKRDYQLACASNHQQTTAALTCRQILASEQIRGYLPFPPPTKRTGFASNSGTASGKSGVGTGHVHPSRPSGDAPVNNNL